MIGAGLIIYRAESMDDARELARNDPMHAEGIRTFTLRKFTYMYIPVGTSSKRM